jgi:death on curing protein
VGHIYLTLEDVLWLHDEQMRLYGGAPGVRDEGLILSGLLRPQTGYYADLVEEAAALWESLTMNHGFVDGNKRAAFASLISFLGLNGVRLTGTQDEWIEFILSNLEGGTFRKAVLQVWIGQHSQSFDPAV